MQGCIYLLHLQVCSNVFLSFAAPSTAKSLTVTRVFQDGIELNWLPPTEPNGEVHYVIEYKREDSGSWTSVNTTSNSTHYNLTGLHSGTNYTIRVVAVNSAGRTPSSTPTSQINKSRGENNHKQDVEYTEGHKLDRAHNAIKFPL